MIVIARLNQGQIKANLVDQFYGNLPEAANLLNRRGAVGISYPLP